MSATKVDGRDHVGDVLATHGQSWPFVDHAVVGFTWFIMLLYVAGPNQFSMKLCGEFAGGPLGRVHIVFCE